MASSLVLSDKARHIKKQRDRGCVGLRQLPFGQKATINKQLAEMMGGMMERECSWGAYVGVLSLCAGQQMEQGKKYNNKIRCRLRWPCYNISQATTNQKHVGTMEQVCRHRCGARLSGSKSNAVNLILRLFVYHFLHTMSLWCHETSQSTTTQNTNNTTTMVGELLAPPVAWIQWIHAAQGAGGLVHILSKAALEGFCFIH
jgi:hypothetical protein